MNIKLTNEALLRVNKLRELHKSRGLKVKNWCNIISDILIDANETVWEQKIEEQTPKEFVLEQALNDPELIDKIHKLILKSKKTKNKSLNN